MTTFKITAQAYVGLGRATKVIQARTEAEAILMVAAVLDAAGYYVLVVQVVAR